MELARIDSIAIAVRLLYSQTTPRLALTEQMTTSDTGVDRVFGTDYGSIHDDIFRLTFTLDSPVVLPAGEYFFSHDATIIPEPLTMLGVFAGVTGLAGYVRRRARQ